jgi:dynein intermediate chain 2
MQKIATSSGAHTIVDISPDDELKREFIQASRVETEISNVPVLSCQGTNTHRVATVGRGAQHREGGWPQHVDATEVEEQIKFCKRAQRDEAYLEAVASCSARMVDRLRINTAVDIYETYFDGAADAADDDAAAAAADQAPCHDGYGEPDTVAALCPIAKLSADLPPLRLQSSAVSSLSWMMGSGTASIAVGYGAPAGALFDDNAAVPTAAVWDIGNASAPTTTLMADTGPCTTVATSQKDGHVVVGGTNVGVVQFWDTREPSRPAGRSPLTAGHKGPVTTVKCMMAKGLEFFSVGLDGRMLFWDARQLRAPTTAVALTSSDRAGSLHAATCADYDPLVAGTNKILVGTAEGAVLTCSKGRAGGAPEKVSRVNAHYGPVADVARHAAFPKAYATIGDWGFKLFADDLRSPFFTSPFGAAHGTCGRWHTTRPAILITGDSEGTLAFWDVLQSMREPAMQLKLAVSTSLLAVAPHVGGKIVAVGDAAGAVHVVELPAVLAAGHRSEKSMVAHLFEAQWARERSAQQAADARQKKGPPQRMQPAADASGSAADLAAQLDAAAAEYLKQIGAE